MRVTLDGEDIFSSDGLNIEVKSAKRASVERSAAGLNGVLSIDLGSRSRKIRQTGKLRAASVAALNEMIATVESYMDGGTHTLVGLDGSEFCDLRLDEFRVKSKGASGGGAACEYEIIYTQLKV